MYQVRERSSLAPTKRNCRGVIVFLNSMLDLRENPEIKHDLQDVYHVSFA